MAIDRGIYIYIWLFRILKRNDVTLLKVGTDISIENRGCSSLLEQPPAISLILIFPVSPCLGCLCFALDGVRQELD